MTLIHLTLPKHMAEEVERLLDTGMFSSTSELVREAARTLILEQRNSK